MIIELFNLTFGQIKQASVLTLGNSFMKTT